MQYAASLNVPGAYLVESFPILKHVPNFLAPWKAEVQRRGREEAAVNMDLVRVVQRDIQTVKTPDSVPTSLCKQLLEARAADPPILLPPLRPRFQLYPCLPLRRRLRHYRLNSLFGLPRFSHQSRNNARCPR